MGRRKGRVRKERVEVDLKAARRGSIAPSGARRVREREKEREKERERKWSSMSISSTSSLLLMLLIDVCRLVIAHGPFRW